MAAPARNLRREVVLVVEVIRLVPPWMHNWRHYRRVTVEPPAADRYSAGSGASFNPLAGLHKTARPRQNSPTGSTPTGSNSPPAGPKFAHHGRVNRVPACGPWPQGTGTSPDRSLPVTGLASTLATIWRLAVPYFRSEDWIAGRTLLAAVVTIELAIVAINVMINQW